MTGYLGHLAKMVVTPGGDVRPRLPGLFESGYAGPSLDIAPDSPPDFEARKAVGRPTEDENLPENPPMLRNERFENEPSEGLPDRTEHPPDDPKADSAPFSPVERPKTPVMQPQRTREEFDQPNAPPVLPPDLPPDLTDAPSDLRPEEKTSRSAVHRHEVGDDTPISGALEPTFQAKGASPEISEMPVSRIQREAWPDSPAPPVLPTPEHSPAFGEFAEGRFSEERHVKPTLDEPLKPSRCESFNFHTPCESFNFHTPYESFNFHTPYESFNFHTPYESFNFHTPYESFNFHTPSQSVPISPDIPLVHEPPSARKASIEHRAAEPDSGTLIEPPSARFIKPLRFDEPAKQIETGALEAVPNLHETKNAKRGPSESFNFHTPSEPFAVRADEGYPVVTPLLAEPNVTPSTPEPSPRRENSGGRTIQVNIGRIEVRATSPRPEPTPKVRPMRRRPKLTLDQYLRQRNEVKR